MIHVSRIKHVGTMMNDGAAWQVCWCPVPQMDLDRACCPKTQTMSYNILIWRVSALLSANSVECFAVIHMQLHLL